MPSPLLIASWVPSSAFDDLRWPSIAQALHDVASKAFRRENLAADVTLQLEAPNGHIHTKTVPAPDARRFDFVKEFTASRGVDLNLYNDTFIAMGQDGDEVVAHRWLRRAPDDH